MNSARSRNFDEIPHNPADLVALQDRSGFPYHHLEEKIAKNARSYEVLKIFHAGLDHTGFESSVENLTSTATN